MILYCSAIYRLQNKKIKKSSPKFHSLCARLLKISEHLVEDTEGEQIPERRREGIQVWRNALASQQLPTIHKHKSFS